MYNNSYVFTINKLCNVIKISYYVFIRSRMYVYVILKRKG